MTRANKYFNKKKKDKNPYITPKGFVFIKPSDKLKERNKNYSYWI